ncbi:hypothetical protein K470DRAFT_223395 [Piedraia hortae CBS 480.64]|uniref:Large ribosomal subunit protein mL54 n=1 Tax=Piedraia hortae CBS 480.64 TaxID=1314780 RepID=A0A6A7BSD3_9PEZI|nr:hypothetical protein K470DRAFT_223395 [Piedraia hortae CBS 480.64]
MLSRHSLQLIRSLLPSIRAYSTSTTPSDSSTPKVKKTHSIAPAGLVLKGLNFQKNFQDPIAKENDEYPDWLWHTLDAKKETAEAGLGADEGDLYSKSKSQRKKAAAALLKRESMKSEAEKTSPREQTRDLPAGDGSLEEAVRAESSRRELTRDLRYKRRKEIRERNYLSKM